MEQTMIPDTHSFVKDMAAAGMPEPVAEAFVKNYSKHLVGNLATKQDIEDLRKDTAVIIAKLETKLSTALAETRNRTHQMELRSIYWCRRTRRGPHQTTLIAFPWADVLQDDVGPLYQAIMKPSERRKFKIAVGMLLSRFVIALLALGMKHLL